MVEDLAPDAGFLLVAGLLSGLVDPFFAGVFAAVVSRETFCGQSGSDPD